MKNKILSFLFAIVASTNVLLAEDYYNIQIGDLFYNLYNSGTNHTAVVIYCPICATEPNSLISINIPEFVTYDNTEYTIKDIDGSAFSQCENISTIVVAENNPYLDSRNNCNAVIRKSDNTLILGCKNTVIPSSVTRIGSSAFAICPNLIHIDLPNSIQSIGAEAFSRCTNLTSIVIPNGVTEIARGAFKDCSKLETVVLPHGLVSIADETFEWCSKLKNINIPEGVTRIGSSSFRGCYALSAIKIPSTVTQIWCEAFESCTSLSTITINAETPPELCYSAESPQYHPIPATIQTIFVPHATLASYQSALGWSVYADKITEIPFANITFIPNQHGMFSADYLYSVIEEYDVFSLTAIPDYGYHFVQWNDSITTNPRTIELTQDTTFGASFAPNQYTITTQAEHGTIANGGKYDYNTQVTLIANADEHYHFVRWSDGEMNATRTITVTKDTTYVAIFDIDKFLIKFNDEDGTVLKSDSVEYGVLPIAPTSPTKDSTAQYAYAFDAWSPTIAVVTSNAIYTATYTATLREYLVSFLDEDSSIISCQNYQYGQTPVAPTEPVKQATAEYSYTFAGWDIPISQVQGVQSYKATYNATKNSYTITWKTDDGSTIDQTKVEYGVVPTHTDAIKAATTEYTYTFTGWSPAVVSVTGDATYRATFTAVKNKYLIIFRDDDGTELKRDSVEYGVLPIVPTAPTKESTAQYTYTFAGWLPSISVVTGNAIYTATYTSTLKSYIVTFVNEDSSIISMQSYKYSEFPTLPATPTKTATAEYTYTFAGWTPEVIAVTGDAMYRATFNATKNSYTITWQNEDGSLIDQTTVEYGVIPTHAEPTKEATAEYTYTFAGWTPDVIAVTGDATYKATFNSTKNKYLIVFQDEDGTELKSGQVEYGEMPIAPAVPSKEPTSEYIYTFAGWMPEIVVVTKNATYTATYEATPISEGVENLSAEGSAPRKVMIDGNVFILRGERVYTLQGQEVK